MNIINNLKDCGLLAGIVIAKGVTITESPSMLKTLINELISLRKGQDFPDEKLKSTVRNLLKTGGFKATGRNKPASEYLIQALKEERFPIINNLVDINNYLSVKTAFPISLLDLDMVGNSLIIRHGLKGEKYVFNSGGQELDLFGCICACDENGEPLGTPVKDSMKGKIKEQSQNIAGIIYAPANITSETQMKEICKQFEALLKEFGNAQLLESIIC